MKAICVTQTTASGDEHTTEIAIFSEGNDKLMHSFLEELKAEVMPNVKISIEDYESPPLNPKSVKDLDL